MFVTCNSFTKSSYISFVQQLKNVLKARFFILYLSYTQCNISFTLYKTNPRRRIMQIFGCYTWRKSESFHELFNVLWDVLDAHCSMHGSRNFIQGGSKGYSSFQGETEAYFQKFYYLNLRNLNFPRGRGVRTLPPATLPMIRSCAVYLKLQHPSSWAI